MDYGNGIVYSRLYLVSLLILFLVVMALATFAIASSWQNLFLEQDNIAYIDLQEVASQIREDPPGSYQDLARLRE